MDRWTMRELKETDDITFAIQILYERRKGLTPYSPLGMKLAEAADRQENDAEVLEDVTDFSDCDEETKAQILENAAKLEEMRCNPCEPTSPECDACELGG